jgi:hypothetical protein
MSRITRTPITDPAVIEALCRIQARFVDAWNEAELNHGIGQTHDLPAGATYTGTRPARGASFVLPDGTFVCIYGKAPWWHWHDGWSFCLHPITPAQVRKVVVEGNELAFREWLLAAAPTVVATLSTVTTNAHD